MKQKGLLKMRHSFPYAYEVLRRWTVIGNGFFVTL